MKRYQTLFLLFSSFILIAGCSQTPTGFHSVPVETPKKELAALLGKDYKTVLYKAKIDVFGRYFSGLFFFKKVDLHSYRIVFLSELGLNLLDLEYIKGVFTVKNCQPFLKKESVLNTLKNDLKLLIQKVELSPVAEYYKGDQQPRTAIAFETEESKYIYFYNTADQLVEVHQDSGAFQGVELKIEGYKNNFPKQIQFTHDWIDLTITLNLLNVKQ